ncbi:probable E3 SUMO-protein ligase RNF212 isoform X2 [Portunus trituberculatus]|nr:probable E3 SUMO-protein ligase RNF212 isoform X2 [Portunus trituberculatus]XP_045125372.1 probable E3 SUMO-protein ligase RNF212 isoform X2 [Portunus trituberculatus]
MDWINCNLCCRQPGDDRERTFTLSSCGHIFCDLCLARVESREKCAVCSSTCQMMQLSSKMKPDAEMFFQEPATMIKKHYTLITRLLDFQRDHRIRLVSFHRKIMQKYRELEKQMVMNKSQEAEKYSAAINRIQELEREVQRLRSVIASMEAGGTSTQAGKNPSPKHVSPSGTMISPGRLTMVKKNHGPPQPGTRGVPSISPTPPYSLKQGSNNKGRAFSPVACHYLQPRPPDGPLHPITGIGYYKNISPVVSRKNSPARSMPGNMSQLPAPAPNQGHLSTPGFQPFMHPSQLQPRHTPINYPSPDLYTRQPLDFATYKKYAM